MSGDTKPSYRLADSGDFVIENYNDAKPFASFFPGIAGPHGIPMWVFYVNRGQCICSIGVQDKEHPILEFLSANRACQLAPTQGFRTFIKIRHGARVAFCEPFQNRLGDKEMQRTQQMIIGPARLLLVETNRTLGLEFRVEYFNVPEDSYDGLVRVLQVRNLRRKPLKVEILDGLSMVIPYGIDNHNLKHMRWLVKAFAAVTNLDRSDVPFFKTSVKQEDKPEVTYVTEGNFYAGFTGAGRKGRLVRPIVDPQRVFGQRDDLSFPEQFLARTPFRIGGREILENRFPCAMGFLALDLPARATRSYTSIIGHCRTHKELNRLVPRITRAAYVARKRQENEELIDRLTQNSFIHSSSRAFDLYCRQNFLDNVLRGGIPMSYGTGKTAATVHLYSRKHGDMERDYNDYHLSPTPYSQGNGNFRDINQNRRSDLLFNPDVREDNVEHFYNLLQLDGFNPLVTKPTTFRVKDRRAVEALLPKAFAPAHAAEVAESLKQSFTPGQLMASLADQGLRLKMAPDRFLGELLPLCEKRQETDYGHGFWIDHWTYNLDLLENYLAVYPERLRHILLDKCEFTFFNNPHRVAPRRDKYVLWDGKPMQLGAVVWDSEKEALAKRHPDEACEVRTQQGVGGIYRTNLLVKLLCLIANKLASLDPFGVGVEMEADKPGWYDPLNGLPGQLGSSVCETIEIKRHIQFLADSVGRLGVADHMEFPVFVELKALMDRLRDLLCAGEMSDLAFWDEAATAREHYREQTRLGVSGEEARMSWGGIREFLGLALGKLERGISRAWDPGRGVLRTYFINQVTDYEEIQISGPDGTPQPKKNQRGQVCFRPKAFSQVPLPLFLEGPVHFLRTERDPARARALARAIRKTGLYDRKLRMYKVNECLDDQPMEIGRTRTFSRGWLENESVWLHMEYKYLLELLRGGLHEEFYRDIRTALVPFMKPAVYGRSILENSSFIASSANPDPSIHGNGFVARLSGSTAEFVHILLLMTVGRQPFTAGPQGSLRLRFAPVLPGWLFTKKSEKCMLWADGQRKAQRLGAGTFAFSFLGRILVVYHNPLRRNTFGARGVRPRRLCVTDEKGRVTAIQGDTIEGDLARRVRERKITRIDVDLG